MARHRGSLYQRFQANVDKSGGPAACWPWTGTIKSTGYGQLTISGPKRRVELAHRLAARYAFGPLQKGLFVCHRCDHPACCNPTHLFLGTQSENIRDAWIKCRIVGHRKLSDQQVLDIRSRYATEAVTYRQLAADFGVSAVQVGCIVRGEVWRHLTPPTN